MRSKAPCSWVARSCNGCGTDSASSNGSADNRALAASAPRMPVASPLVPAFTGLRQPALRYAYARGTMVGCRVARQGRISPARRWKPSPSRAPKCCWPMQRDAHHPLIELRVDGGATANDLLMQFQADLLGVPVVRPQVTAATALEPPISAGLGTEFLSSPKEVAATAAPNGGSSRRCHATRRTPGWLAGRRPWIDRGGSARRELVSRAWQDHRIRHPGVLPADRTGNCWWRAPAAWRALTGLK